MQMQCYHHTQNHSHLCRLLRYTDISMEEENYASLSLEQEKEEEEPHRLSFSHLPIPLNNPSSTASPRPNLLFEFSSSDPTPAPPHSYHNDIVFCGKIIHEEEEGDEDELNEYQKRDYFATVKSKSLRNKSSSPESNQRRLSATARFSGELIMRPKSPDVEYHVQRVNISSLTSMSAKSRRRMFMFGPVKFKPEMELSAIKQRQGKQAAAGESGRKGQWEMFKSSFRGRSHFTSVLARSLGCGVGGWSRQDNGSHRLVAAD